MRKLPFGKHKGEDIEDIDSDYLEWFLDNIDSDCSAMDAILQEIEEELEIRNMRNIKYL